MCAHFANPIPTVVLGVVLAAGVLIELTGGHEVTVTFWHSASDPNPPFKLLRTQIVSFSSMLVEFSLALLFSNNVKVSITLIEPIIENVLFLRAAATAK